MQNVAPQLFLWRWIDWPAEGLSTNYQAELTALRTSVKMICNKPAKALQHLLPDKLESCHTMTAVTQ